MHFKTAQDSCKKFGYHIDLSHVHVILYHKRIYIESVLFLHRIYIDCAIRPTNILLSEEKCRQFCKRTVVMHLPCLWLGDVANGAECC